MSNFKPLILSNSKPFLTLRSRLLLVLTWLRVYPCYRVLGLLFNLDKSAVCRNLKIMVSLLQQVTDTALLDLNGRNRSSAFIMD